VGEKGVTKNGIDGGVFLFFDILYHKYTSKHWWSFEFSEAYDLKNHIEKGFFYCCAGWGYIGIFTKVLVIYQINHTSIHPLHCSLLRKLLKNVTTSIYYDI
jgi:hypothetical protein